MASSVSRKRKRPARKGHTHEKADLLTLRAFGWADADGSDDAGGDGDGRDDAVGSRCCTRADFAKRRVAGNSWRGGAPYHPGRGSATRAETQSPGTHQPLPGGGKRTCAAADAQRLLPALAQR